MSVETELRAISSKLDRVISKINKMEVILLGNGSKGHEQRLQELENLAKPLSKGDIIKRRMLEVSIMGLIIGTIEFIIPLLLK